jgi:hypothetical protein
MSDDANWSEVSSKKTKNRAPVAAGAFVSAAQPVRAVLVAGVKTGTGRKAPVPQGKVFVGGLSWDTDEESLHNYFCEYGEISALEIPRGENKVNQSRALLWQACLTYPLSCPGSSRLCLRHFH